MSLRERTENREEGLSPYAAKSRLSRGRLRAEEPCPIRTAFQRDRDRIIHCSAFRRLQHKTHLFISLFGDYRKNRLTHSLEVQQIGRTLARALNLNEDLIEAMALGHDIGHAPFGHVGGEVLGELTRGAFKHHEQSLRVVDVLENNGQGLNLTWEVRDGIVKHSEKDILNQDWGNVSTLEGQLLKLVDIVSGNNHNIDDALRAGILAEADLPAEITAVLGHSPAERIKTTVSDIIANSWSVTGYDAAGTDGRPQIRMSQPVAEATHALMVFRAKLFHFHFSETEAEKAREVLRRLYHYFINHENELPPEYSFSGDTVEQKVIDYLAGMTDQYELRIAEEIAGK
ncbi:MAG: deoxyguanosinetriphosphate triphosphohydrolase [Chloroflexi bacterium]|nr:deoxyguanosinetriphosphate triphosphohydrolase [Chloroflexota bacterium]